MWWWQNVILNTAINPAVPSDFVTGSEASPAQFEAPDDHTLVITFADPNPLFLERTSFTQPFVPSHYMQQFHADFAEDAAALEAQVQESGFETWDQYFLDRDSWFLNPERPSINPWLAMNPLSEELFLLERNPYCWQVDEAGNQLPYIDRVTHRLFSGSELLDLWLINGEIDFQARHVSLGNYTLYKENEANGDYQVYPGLSDDHTCITPNMTTREPRVREFFQTRDVRIALSLAVDRVELNELIFDGLAEPRQYSPLRESPQYYEKQATAYIEYDPERANELLDGAGYAERDAEGFRLWKDGSGETLSFVVEGTAQPGSPDEDGVQLILRYFADVGVKASYRGVERTLYEEHWGSNNIECAYWGSGRSLVPIVDAAFFLGTGLDRPWGVAWGMWRLDPTDPNAEEPPQDHWIRQIWAIWDQIAVEPDPQQQTQLFYQILDIWAEELPQIGYLGEKPWPIIVKNGLRNLRKDYRFPLSNPTKHEHLIPTQTYFWEDPENHS
jgi:peptide/nickel transport system substrate-binding protein